ncbi:hypothetical protein KTT_12360 [Tengunoibacter tsumagoiensis]|uniref:Uncharacterized protein n=2 Tax=Tengunoibacter tsumagoiensis TaxID=2014871 RepID=A0A401ZWY5_9CHLR|nr:hypothetical protein KTT_12360 [Tengunoibacter tsumagoiensis]
MVINGDKLRWLLWLRWRMLIRNFTHGGVAQIIGGVLQILFSVLFMGGIAAVTLFLFRFFDATARTELLFLELTGLFVMWVILPLFDMTRNEGLDLSKLVQFPLTKWELILSLLLSTLLDIPMFGLFLILLGAVIGWAFSLPLALFTLVTLFFFAIQLVGVGQFIVSLFQGVLHNRRFRDLSIILTVFLFALIYLAQFGFRALATSGISNGFQSGSFSTYLQWTPPGVAARAIQLASINNWGGALLWLVALIVIDAAFLFLWLVFTQRSLLAAEEGDSAPVGGTVKKVRSRSTSIGVQAQVGTQRRGFLPVQVREIMLKDLKYIRRDPQITRMFLQSLIIVVFYVFYFGFTNFTGGSRGDTMKTIGPWAVLVSPALILLSLFILTYNILGFERQSLTTLFLFPIHPKYILWGKNLLAFLIGLAEMLIIILVAAAFTGGWNFFIPALTMGIAGMGVMIGIGNFTSSFLPQRMKFGARGIRAMANMTAEGGCLRGALSGLSVYGTMILLIPVALAVILPLAFSMQWIWVISIPLSLLYGAGFYYGLTRLSWPRLLNKAPEILNIVAKE